MTALIPHLPTTVALDQAQRLFHGRGHCYPGLESLTLDLYPPVLLLTTFTTPEPEQMRLWRQQVEQWWSQAGEGAPLNLVWQNRGVSPAATLQMAGQVPSPHWIREGQELFLVDLMRGQNHGLFLDMAEGRRWVRAHARGKRVLNLFAYTCGFSVAACAGGAESVVNLDMSGGALKTGKRNHAKNKLGSGVRYLAHDLFKTFGKLKKLGPYDLVVIDPPSFQHGSFIATKDYCRVLRRLPELLAPDGDALLCLNAPELSRDFLTAQVAEHAPSLSLVDQLPNPPSFPESDPDRGLKVFHYRLGRVDG
ncbi:SAM-dependent methyltransferase [Ferrimonas sediminicola]|uniref:SAM-dependent methyltransferase n=1 Tax=Ferrimonas sediminicola TaxID=2569538 RepID=A0A4U1BB98_9GAMM|nr:class I SAM-dependent methyltransferase [Ferrimonas sediminicola]TKB47280.1 SAM-dependent methyltransferase [Ferrimonas sediminicola]